MVNAYQTFRLARRSDGWKPSAATNSSGWFYLNNCELFIAWWSLAMTLSASDSG
jgi:hypothetical protein